jgi:hypothetical protein
MVYLSMYCHASASYETVSATNQPAPFAENDSALLRKGTRSPANRRYSRSVLSCVVFPTKHRVPPPCNSLSLSLCFCLPHSLSASVFLTLSLSLFISLSLSLLSLTPHKHTRISTLPTWHKRFHISYFRTPNIATSKSLCIMCVCFVVKAGAKQ